MSEPVTARVSAHSRSTGKALALLRTLAALADDDGICHGKLETVAKAAGTVRRHALRCIAKLCAAGELYYRGEPGLRHQSRFAVLVGLSDEQRTAVLRKCDSHPLENVTPGADLAGRENVTPGGEGESHFSEIEPDQNVTSAASHILPVENVTPLLTPAEASASAGQKCDSPGDVGGGVENVTPESHIASEAYSGLGIDLDPGSRSGPSDLGPSHILPGENVTPGGEGESHFVAIDGVPPQNVTPAVDAPALPPTPPGRVCRYHLHVVHWSEPGAAKTSCGKLTTHMLDHPLEGWEAVTLCKSCAKTVDDADMLPHVAIIYAWHYAIPVSIRPPGKPVVHNNSRVARDLRDDGITPDQVRAYMERAYPGYLAWARRVGAPIVMSLNYVKNNIKGYLNGERLDEKLNGNGHGPARDDEHDPLALPEHVRLRNERNTKRETN
jgi:hypothetical protein